MAKNSLFDRAFFRMLFTLPDKKRHNFAAYISLRQFNSNAGLAKLLELILKKYLKEKDREEATFEELGRDSGMAGNTLEKSISQLLGLLNDFMLVHAALEDRDRLHTLPFEAWMELDLAEDLLDREFRRRLRTLHRLPVSDLHLHEELLLEHSRAKLEAAKPRKDQGNLFDRHIQLLDSYCAVARFRYDCAAANAARIFGTASPQLKREGLSEAELAQLPEVGQAYFRMLELLRSDELVPDQITDGLDFLRKNEGQFSLEDRSDLYGYLLNTGFRGMVTGFPAFNDIVYRIYNALLENGLLLASGNLSGTHFKNIVTVMVRTRRLAEGRTFIAKYASRLDADDRTMLPPYCTGIVEFHSGNFREAIHQFSSLLKRSPDDQFWSLEARSVLWKAYFEAMETLDAQEHEEMLRLYHSFRNFVTRSKQISDHHRTGYLNFIRLFNRLIQLSESEDPMAKLTGLQTLLEKAQEMQKVINKEWVIATIKKKIELNSSGIQ
jgi:ferritin